ncbi:beta-D-glucosyl crocetin beta-1,6-glucosyltransferase-like [Impatiens glandulifera]|uniref:beta-D-glucosyl crocetin beta-1,6-glucosyltransferase-like n=1 Tax=Impatiens glandulifera TaxID=253017 RepID=UPI001FB0FA78|nr:beta-D-glucosyl crocetin beta-1,6-glucosyltransferase-like [Impatiens glandulifera]
METKNPRLNVVMLPWLAHGHVSPYLELAKRLADRNFQIYLCSTPINLSSIKKRVTQNYSQSIKLIEFHLPSQPDLPDPNFHTTNGLPLHLNRALKRSMDMASPSVIEIIKTLKPDILIYDYNQQQALIEAASLGVPIVQFFTMSAAILCNYLRAFLKSDVEIPHSSTNHRASNYWQRKGQEMLKQYTNDQGQSRDSVQLTRKATDTILVKTIGEMEGKYIEHGPKLFGIKIVPTGPLVQKPEEDGEEEEEHNREIMEWLNKKEKSSTVFVSFGTEYFLSREEREEIAKGLELSMVNFIWVLRFSFEDKISIEEALPNGFLTRVGDRGLVVEKWAPQARILGHPNVGGFVSHCGWGSTMEAMSFGIPIVAIPMNLDQPGNARLVVEMDVGLEVNRDDNGGLSGEEIAEFIKEVMVGDEDGKKIRDKVGEMKDKIKSKGEEDIDGVVEELIRLHNKNIAGESKCFAN